MGLRGYRTLDPGKSAARKTEILHSAARVFARRGYHESTTEDIARAMGVTKGVIYYYFKAKEDIFFEVMLNAAEGSLSRLERVIARPGSAVDVLREAIKDLLVYNLDDREEGYFAMLVIHNQKILSQSHRDRLRETQQRFRGIYRDLVARGVAEGTIVSPDPHVTALTLLSTCSYVSDWYSRDGRLELEDVVELVTDQLMNGVIARSP